MGYTAPSPIEYDFVESGYNPESLFDFGLGVYIPPENIIFDFVKDGYTPETEFNFGLVDGTYTPPEEIIFNFTESGYVGGEDTVFNFDAENTPDQQVYNGSFTGVIATLNGALIGEYDSNVTRFVMKNVCSDIQDSIPEPVDICVPSENLIQNPVDICVPRETGTPINTITCFPVEQLSLSFTQVCTVQEDGVLLPHTTCSPVEDLILTYNPLCSTQEQGIFVDNSICAPLDIVYLQRPVWCSTVDYTGNVIHAYEYSYYPDTHALYSPSHDFDLNHSSIAIIESVANTAYEPNDCFDFIDNGYSQPSDIIFNLGVSDLNASQTYDVYDDPTPAYVPSEDFTTPYNSTLTNVIPVYERGHLRNTTCGKMEQLSTEALTFCTTYEQAIQPEPGTSLWIDDPRPPHEDPPDQVVYTVPILETYCMEHVINVTLEDLTTVIEINNISLSDTVDNFATTFSATLVDKNQVSLVEPVNNTPVKLIITINSVQWTVIVESLETNSTFGTDSIQLSGSSVSKLLSHPYLQGTSATQGSLLTVQQLAELQLPIGWSINWTGPVWNIPGGSYSHFNRTPIQAVMDIARQIGSIVIPDRNQQILHIKPRYPVLPWNFSTATPDVTIPLNVMESISKTAPPVSTINGVYVHGLESGGRLAFSRFNGTAGDVLAQTQSNSLMTDVIGTRALSERILAGEYTQPEITEVTIPMDGTTIPLIPVGTFVDLGGVRGVVNSTTMNASFGKVRQVLTIGEKSANNFTFFQSLLPKDPLLVATLSSVSGNTSLMTMLDGGIARVHGVGNPGLQYYIQSGRIQGEAPNLPLDLVVI